MKIRMNTRAKFSVALVALGLFVALLPSPASRLLRAKPERLVALLNDEESRITVDQVARFVVNEDDKVQIIDLRSAAEFGISAIPGSVNIPIDDFLQRNPAALLAPKTIKTILCSNSDHDADDAFIYARAMRFNNTFIMKGGMEEWTKTVMNSSFSGDKITARENAVFETRTRARKMFSEFNALPDSLKQKYFAARLLERKKLGGGCE